MIQQRINRLFVALHNIEYTVGQASFLEQTGQDQRCGRVPLRGLEHKGIAAGDGDGEHPHRHHGREVERSYTGANPQGLAHCDHIDAGSNVFTELAFHELRNAARKFHDFQAAGNFAVRVAEHLAMFSRNGFGQLVGMLFNERLELEHHPRAAQRWCGRPGRERISSRIDSGINQAGTGQRNFTRWLAKGWIKYRCGA